MVSFTVDFLGCKVSHVDALGIRERLVHEGHVEIPGGQAEVAVISTCCVTNEALAKSRKTAARASRAHRHVYVTGCGAALGRGLAGLPANVTIVGGHAEDAAAVVAAGARALGCTEERWSRDRSGAPRRPSAARLDRVRAFVKIQDGCSFSCGFCVIPLVRGPSRSRHAAAVLEEIARRVGQGHREVVLTGINLGCFRDRAAGYDLPRLVRDAGATPGLERLRLSSIEVNHVSPALVAALRETPTAARHLHVPLQSGDDDVLRSMGRRYSIRTFLDRLEPLTGDFNLTSDVIVGFPTEGEVAFEQTLATVERAGLTSVHVFPYSPRPGTATAADDPVLPAVKKERGDRLRTLARELERRRWQSKVGRDDLVLVDRPGRGYGDDYTPFLVDAPVGELVRVRAAAVTEEGILGVAA